MGLNERRKIKELQESTLPERVKEIEEMKASEASGSYLVQVAHFARAEDAVSLLQKLIADGYDGTVLTRSEQGQTTNWADPFACQYVVFYNERNLIYFNLF